MKLIRSKILRIIPCVLTTLTLVFSPVASLTTAYAAPAVAVPVGVELIGELLVALGLMVGTTDGYVWKANDNPYVSSIFEEQVEGITSGIPIASETLESLKGTVIPDNVYTTDGDKFFVGSKEVTTSDIFVSAKSMVGKSYSMPINIDSAQAFVSYNPSNSRIVVLSPLSDISSGKDYYFIPYYTGVSGSTYILPQCFRFPTSDTIVLHDYITGNTTKPVNFGATGYNTGFYEYMSFAPVYYSVPSFSSKSKDGFSSPAFELFRFLNPVTNNYNWSGLQLVSGDGSDLRTNQQLPDLDPAKVSSGTLLRTTGTPVLELPGDKASLQDSIVQVKPSKDEDGNNGNTPPTPQSPNTWEIWKSVEDLIKFVNTGESTNGGTDFQHFVDNNYTYVNVTVDVPDEIDTHVDITGDVTIHQDTSLPTAGDGSGFFNPDATDVIGALSKDNPIISVVAGLFSAIDPALLGIFSVSVSLLLVLGLWRLIRG